MTTKAAAPADFEILDHTADLYILGRGQGLEAVASVVRGIAHFFSVSSKDQKLFFKKPDGEFWEIELLSDIIAKCDALGLTPVDAQARSDGLIVWCARHPLEIKAVAYHGFERGKDYIKVLFDV